MLRLNLGCGEEYLEGFINIDVASNVKCDVTCDIRTQPLPYSENSVDEVWVLHALEHCERKYWDHIFYNIRRVLRINGKLVLAYPEFGKCVTNFLENKSNLRGFWLHTIFGRQQYPSDYHVTAVHTPEMKEILASYGFYRILTEPDLQQNHDTVLVALKDPSPMNYEALVSKEILGREDSVSIGDL